MKEENEKKPRVRRSEAFETVVETIELMLILDESVRGYPHIRCTDNSVHSQSIAGSMLSIRGDSLVILLMLIDIK